ncbi:dicarboxylate/amino acid:cation symporter [Novosphingobium sp. KACC 22771]|uniref:dicarboxylate/amino acid:cation symporter n=1 Tax=Novosphingobium sp. KACC 22771 TaxID=3025670 RepID=UPI0023659DD6|nr:dicarboxylate/amino acid:cation symporter [Novosphingobium sp. KACC 22771]WDF74812.1 dicarboxylate/amino acid:cation symporter [Novosphingobium sp. KACC 22771]
MATLNPSSPSSPLRWSRPLPHWPLLAGLVIGTLAGALVHVVPVDRAALDFVLINLVRPVEQLFLQVLFLLILPMVFSAIVTGLARLRGRAMVRDLLLRLFAAMLGMTVVSAVIGMAMANLFRPGEGMAIDLHQNPGGPARTGDESSLLDLLLARPVMALVVMSVLVGFAISRNHGRNRNIRHLVLTTEGLFEVGMSIVTLVARFAPVAVLCVMFDMTAVFGWTLLVHLSGYFSVVVAALCLHLLVVSVGLAWMMGDVSPARFLRSLRSVMVIAFTTSSSFSTLPAALHAAEQDLGLPARVARTTLGLGCVANQGGTIIYTTVTVIFLAQCFGMELTAWQQFMVFGLSILAGLGTMGVPAGSLPLTTMLLALLHVPNEGIGLIIGIDRLMDMCRTVPNVVGDLAVAAALRRSGEDDT